MLQLGKTIVVEAVIKKMGLHFIAVDPNSIGDSIEVHPQRCDHNRLITFEGRLC